MVDAPHAAFATPDRGWAQKARLLAIFLVVAGGFAALPAGAAEGPDPADTRRAEAAATEAKVFFKAGLFDKASAKFMEAFAISKRPSLMYNAARAYEEGQNLREAVALFKHYRDLSEVGVDGRRDADERIARMEEVLRQQAAIEDARRADALRLERARQDEAAQLHAERERQQRAALEREKAAQLAQDATPSAPGVAPRRVSWAIVATGLGVIAIAGAAYAAALYEADSARKTTIASDADVTGYLGHADEAKTFRAVALGAGVVGAGLAAWAALDWWQSGGTPVQNLSPRSGARVFPVAGGGMMAVRGSF